jgi:glycosyltransferase involved in cell wall biosynthesis
MLSVCVSNKVRLIHVHNSPDFEGLIALLVSKITGTPYVFEVHDHTPEMYAETMGLDDNSTVFKLFKMMERAVVSNSSGNIFVSETMQRYFQMAYDLDPSESIVVYGGPYRDFPDSNKYYNSELDDLARENSMINKLKILYLGSMEEGFRRGLDILVESMRYLVHTYRSLNIVLVFVGDGGGMIEKLKELALDCKVSTYVSFQGMLPRREAYKWLRIADIVVDPLRGSASTEACVTNKDLEYMAAQKTIIASDLMGHREILIDGYDGLLFRDGDALDLAGKIRFVIKNAETSAVQKLGINAGKDFHEKYCWEEQEPKLLRLYKKLIN